MSSARSTRLVASAVSFGDDLNDTEFRILIILSQRPYGENSFIGKVDHILADCSLKRKSLFKTLVNFHKDFPGEFSIQALKINVDFREEYVVLEPKK